MSTDLANRSSGGAAAGGGGGGAAAATPGKETLTGALGVTQAADPGARLAAAAGADTPSSAGAMSERAGVQASVFSGGATQAALQDLGTSGAARGNQVFVASGDPQVLGHELAHVAQGDAGGDREGAADRAASAWGAGASYAIASGDGPSPLSFYAGHATGDRVLVRGSPGGTDIVGRLPLGAHVEVGEQNGDWLHVHANDPPLDGWSHISFIARDTAPTAPTAQTGTPAPTAQTATPAPTAQTGTPAPTAQSHPPGETAATPAPAGVLPPGPGYCTGDGVGVRDAASASGHRIGELAMHDVVTILGGDANWTQISHDSVTGYTATRFLAAGAAPPTPQRAAEQVIANASGPLSDQAVVEVLNAERGTIARRAPAWVAALQAAVGVDAGARTGALNSPTIQRVADFQANTMHVTVTGRLDAATLAAITTAHPELGQAGAATLASTSGVNGPWNDDAAILAQVTTGSFLGISVRAHPLLLDRLAAANAYLQARFPGQDWATLRQMLGVRTSGTDEFHVLRGGGSYHAKGWAIDVNYSSNPWFGGQAADTSTPAAEQDRRNDEAVAIMWRAVWLTGHGEVYQPGEASDRRLHQTTEQIWAHAAAANSAFHDYLQARSNVAQVRTWLAGGDGVQPMAQRALPARPSHSHANGSGGPFAADLHTELQSATAEQWQQQVAADYATFRAAGSNWEMTGAGARSSTTIMDQHLELVRAMRDAGGLAWGASDIEGEQAGDFMHFDTRTIAACHAYMHR